MAILFAGSNLHASRAHADEEASPTAEPSSQVADEEAAPIPEPSGAVAGDDATAAMEPGADAAGADATAATDTPAVTTKSVRPADPVRLAQIERDLALVRDEQASTTTLWPVLTIALGVAAVATAATAGAVEALSCNDTCHADGWQGITVMGGAAVATAGVVWLRWTHDDLRELASRRYRLERERDDIGASTGEPRSARPVQPRALVLGVGGRF